MHDLKIMHLTSLWRNFQFTQHYIENGHLLTASQAQRKSVPPSFQSCNWANHPITHDTALIGLQYVQGLLHSKHLGSKHMKYTPGRLYFRYDGWHHIDGSTAENRVQQTGTRAVGGPTHLTPKMAYSTHQPVAQKCIETGSGLLTWIALPDLSPVWN
jgi:hypothetical protein